MKSVRMIHATYMSAWNEKPIHIDFDAEEYEKELDDKITQE